MFDNDVTVLAGWYPDPTGLPQLRWWNTHAWTELTTEARPASVMQVPTRLAHADEELPTRRQHREQLERDEQQSALANHPANYPANHTDAAPDATESRAPLGVTLREVDDPPHAGASAAGTSGSLDESADFESIPRSRSVSRLPIYTTPVWIIALLPLLLLVLSLLLLLGFGSSLERWVTPTIGLLSYLVVVMLAIADRAALGRAGYERRASWAWALLTAPVYLIARSMRLSKVGPLGFDPVLVWAALGILHAGYVLVAPGLIISALPQVFASQAERSIASDASIIGADIAVHCTKALPVIIGQTFTCSATSAKSGPFAVTVSLQRTNGWIDWHVEDWGVYTVSR